MIVSDQRHEYIYHIAHACYIKYLSEGLTFLFNSFFLCLEKDFYYQNIMQYSKIFSTNIHISFDNLDFKHKQ